MSFAHDTLYYLGCHFASSSHLYYRITIAVQFAVQREPRELNIVTKDLIQARVRLERARALLSRLLLLVLIFHDDSSGIRLDSVPQLGSAVHTRDK